MVHRSSSSSLGVGRAQRCAASAVTARKDSLTNFCMTAWGKWKSLTNIKRNKKKKQKNKAPGRKEAQKFIFIFVSSALANSLFNGLISFYFFCNPYWQRATAAAPKRFHVQLVIFRFSSTSVWLTSTMRRGDICFDCQIAYM